jgi:hypothetical protein
MEQLPAFLIFTVSVVAVAEHNRTLLMLLLADLLVAVVVLIRQAAVGQVSQAKVIMVATETLVVRSAHAVQAAVAVREQ